MPPKFWASSDDWSADSSVVSSHDESRDNSVNQDEDASLEVMAKTGRQKQRIGVAGKEMADSMPQNQNIGTVARAMATNFRLPNLQPQQHASLFYLSLIEGRCKTQAANSVNGGRLAEEQLSEDHPEICDLAQHLFTEMCKELVKAGMLPEEFAGYNLLELRRYLSSFDAILNNIATKRTHEVSQNGSYKALPGVRLPSLNRDISSSSFEPSQHLLSLNRDNSPSSYESSHALWSLNGSLFTSSFDPSQALIRRQPFAMATLGQSQNIPAASAARFLSIMDPGGDYSKVQVSRYKREYKYLYDLGSGGFGTVQKARYIIDNTEYAVKKIVIRAERIRILAAKKKLASLLSEIHTMAKLHHRNIVRYYHCWIETHSPTSATSTEGEFSESGSRCALRCPLTFFFFGNTNDSHLRSVFDSESRLVSRVENMQLATEDELRRELRKVRRNSTTHELTEDGIVFEDESSLSPNSPLSSTTNRKLGKGESKGDGLRSFFRRAANDTDDEDDNDADDNDDEEDADDAGDVQNAEDFGDSSDTLNIPRNALAEIPEVDFDAHIYIKMAPYPLSLEDFMWPEQQETGTPIKHCFHALSSVRILLSILDGVEYLHRKNIIHRDLKPGNVFLSILEDDEPSSEGYADITDCKECGATESTKPIRICPCIGDFGLVVDLKACTPAPSSTASEVAEEADSIPFPFSGLQSTSQVGTKYYCPPKIPKTEPTVCPKLDVYSLGVIAFELINKFGTKSERVRVMDGLCKGILPKEVEGHEMAEGIKHMVCVDRDKRWDCATLRKWLLDIEKKHAA